MTHIVTQNECHDNILLILDKQALPKAKLHKHHSHCITLHKVSKKTMIACTCITSSVLRSCSHRMLLPCKRTSCKRLKHMTINQHTSEHASIAQSDGAITLSFSCSDASARSVRACQCFCQRRRHKCLLAAGVSRKTAA